LAVTRQLATVLNVHPGDSWTSGNRSWQVVGVVENPRDLHDSFAITAPGGADPATSVSYVVSHSPNTLPEVHLPSGNGVGIEGVSAATKAAATFAVLALASMFLLFVGLVAVAGFTVVAQRHLRALGMLSSLGATGRQVRLVMVANGAAVGLTAGVAGAVVGLGAWVSLRAWMETVVAHRIDAFALPWVGIAAAVGLAIVTAVAAAWWPARSLSRMSVMASLSGRPPRPQPARRFASLGCVLFSAGVVALVLANPAVEPGDVSHHGRLLLVAGLLTASIGVLLLAPLAIGAVAAGAGRVPVATRLAWRDLARYRGRSGAALAAVTLAVVIAGTISVTAAYESANNVTPVANLPANQLLVHQGDFTGLLPVIGGAELDAARRSVATLARQLGATTIELDGAVDPTEETVSGPRATGKDRAGLLDVTAAGRGKRISLLAPLVVATPTVLAHDGISAGQIDPTADVVMAKSLKAYVDAGMSGGELVLGADPRNTITPHIQTLDMPSYASAPAALITQHGLDALGLQPAVAGWLMQTSRPITDAQVSDATRTAAATGLTVEAADRHATSSLGRDASIAGIILALGVLAMTVGLIRAESADELRTLAATGASARTRRALTSVSAASLALLGALLGLAGAYAEALAWYHHRLGPLGHPPYANLVSIAVGLPVAAAVGGWLLAGRQPAGIARRPLD